MVFVVPAMPAVPVAEPVIPALGPFASTVVLQALPAVEPLSSDQNIPSDYEWNTRYQPVLCLQAFAYPYLSSGPAHYHFAVRPKNALAHLHPARYK